MLCPIPLTFKVSIQTGVQHFGVAERQNHCQAMLRKQERMQTINRTSTMKSKQLQWLRIALVQQAKHIMMIGE
jgi:hypothetical protein